MLPVYLATDNKFKESNKSGQKSIAIILFLHYNTNVYMYVDFVLFYLNDIIQIML